MHSLLHHILISKIHYSTRFSFLQKLLLYYAIKIIQLMMNEAASFEKSISLNENF